MKLNKYLRELGIDENYWLFNEEDIKSDPRFTEDKEGFIDAEFFSLDCTFSLYIYSHLCYFREYCLHAYPAFLKKEYGDRAEEKWEEILDDMIEAFKLQILEDKSYKENNDKKRHILSRNRAKKINKGMRYFIKYYNCLWY